MQCLYEILVPLFIVHVLGESAASIKNNTTTGKTTNLPSMSTTKKEGSGNKATNTSLDELCNCYRLQKCIAILTTKPTYRRDHKLKRQDNSLNGRSQYHK